MLSGNDVLKMKWQAGQISFMQSAVLAAVP
jgi:hypothetical protein